ncbi:MAG TPA: amino acid permease [Puia sp.]|nr:amino acid permease [Puia sp.]
MQENRDRTIIPLKRVLGLPTSILLVAGIMIGSGAFKKITAMSKSLGNEHYILFVWIVAGIITICGAFLFSGLTGLTKETGGIYEYLRLIYGEFVAFLLGWTYFAVVGSGAIAALAFVFSQSADALFHFPPVLSEFKDISLGHFIFPFDGFTVKLLAIVTIVLLTMLNILGIKKAGKLNSVVTIAKIIGILLLIVAGVFYERGTSIVIHDRIPLHPLHGAALFSGFFAATLSALWAYDGWANITFVTGEIKNPERNLPFAIIGGVGIAITLYVLLNYVYMKVLPVNELAVIPDNKIAAAVVANTLIGSLGASLIAVLILICTFGALNGCIISYPRIYFRMSQEKVFFKKAAWVHPNFKTPYIALIYSASWSCVLVFTGTFDRITDLVIFSSYLFLGLTAIGLIKMKRNGKITKRVIGYPVIPWIIILFSTTLLLNTIIVQAKSTMIGVVLIASGIPFYYWFKKGVKRKA